MANSEQWLKLAHKVALSYKDETRSNWTSNTDRGVMIGCINNLLAGKSLSAAQQDAFLRSIRMRVGGQYAERAFPEEVRLTRDQLVRAKKNHANILSQLATAFEYDFVAGVNLRQYHGKVATDITPTCDTVATNLRQGCDKVATNLLPSCDNWSRNVNVLNGIGFSTERNDTKRNETERLVQEDLSSVRASLGLAPHKPLASPSDEVALTPPKQSGSPIGSPVALSHLSSDGSGLSPSRSFREAMEAMGVRPSAGSAQREDKTGAQGERGYSDMTEQERADLAEQAQALLDQLGYMSEQPKAYTGQIDDGIRLRGKAKIECSLWDSNNRITGEVVIGNDIYYVDFEGYDAYEERVFTRHADSKMNKHWLSRYMWHEVGRHYRAIIAPFAHQNGNTVKFAMSALYSDRDCNLVTGQRVAVRAYWKGDTLDAIELYNGTNKQTQKVRVNDKRSARSPAYKHQ